MYLDSVVIAGLAIVILICVMAAYLGMFAYRHIKSDASKAKEIAQHTATKNTY